MKVIAFGGHDINDGVNFRSSLTAAGQTPAEMEPQMVGRTGGAATIGGVVVPPRFLVLRTVLETQTSAYSKRELQQLWYAWFVTDVTQALVIGDDDGGNQRYVTAMPFSIVHSEDGDGFEIVTTLAVDGDVLWRSTAATTVSWTVTTSGASTTVSNGDPAVNDDAYPVITVTPRQQGSAANPYRRFAAVGWRAAQGATNYPVDIVNDALDTRIASTNFAIAAGDDIRVYVDGVDTDYWLDGPNTATTKVWVNLSFQAAQTGTLAAALGVGDATVELSEDVGGWPETGLLMVGSEVMAYTGKSNPTRTFTGVTRGARGTTAASHSLGDAAVWVQREIWIEYGDAGKSAKSVNGDYKPMFVLANSSNTSWDYDEFASFSNSKYSYGAMLRPGGWAHAESGAGVSYGGDRNASVVAWGYLAGGPYVELGLQSNVNETKKTALGAMLFLFNPCGISAANFQNGEFWHGSSGWFKAYVQSGSTGAETGTTQYTIPTGSNSTWTGWSQNVTGLVEGTTFIILKLGGYGSSSYPMLVECSDVTVTLDSDNTPVTATGAEESTYRLQPVIANTTTGESVAIDAAVDVDESIAIDVENHQVTLPDGSDAYNMVSTVEGVRRYILRLQAGDNTLVYTEAALVEVDVDVEFERRFRV